MSNWELYRLEDVATKIGDGLHGTPEYNNAGEYFFINGSNLVDGKILIDANTKRVTKVEYEKYKKDLSARTILLGINGTIGNLALYNNEKCVLGKSACYINVDERFDKHFIKYVLLNNDFQGYIRNNATGTTIKNVGLKLLREYEVLIPSSIKEQTQIATILSSLDNKIELNLEMNQTLEAMAQAIFNAWFVKFNFPDFDGELVGGLPKFWRMTKLGEVIEIKGGTTPSTTVPEYWDGDFYWTTPKDLSNKRSPVIFDTERKITAEGVKQIGSGILPKGTLLLSSRAPIGYLAISQVPISVNQGYIAINGKTVSNLFMLFWLKQNIDSVKGRANGSTFQEISKSNFKEIDIVIADNKTLTLFDSVVTPLFEKIVANEYEIIILKQIRDALLPKLMNGKLEININ